MIELLNSNLFQTLVTFLVGLFAFIVYFRQRSDHKKAAATAILLEVQNAEHALSKIRDSIRNGKLESTNTVIPSNNWNQYQHLFTKDLDKDEWDLISDFYSKAQLLDESIKYNGLAFSNDVEQIRANKQRVLADFAKDLINVATANRPLSDDDANTLTSEFNEKVTAFDQMYMSKQGEFAYMPVKPLNDARMYLEDLRNISTTTVGHKLKKLSK